MCVSTMYGVLCTLYIYYVKSTICLLYRISKPAKSAYGLQLDFSFSHHKRVQLISLSSLPHWLTPSLMAWEKKLLRRTRASLYPLGLIAMLLFFEPLIQCLYIFDQSCTKITTAICSAHTHRDTEKITCAYEVNVIKITSRQIVK